MRPLLIVFFVALTYTSFAQQTQDAKQLYETAKTLMRQADYDNAVLVLQNALKQDPNNIDMQKDLAFTYFLKRDYSNAIDLGKKLTDRTDADEQTYQILGMSYKAIAEYKECAKLYAKAIKSFPNSGVLYNEWGELLAMDKDVNGSITEWEKGISVDPEYSSNYYNAVQYYAQAGTDYVKVLLYGELFLNLESYTTRSADVKGILLEAWKKLYLKGDLLKQSNDKSNSPFVKQFLEILSHSASVAEDGITPDNLTSIRARFILDWFSSKSNEKFPYRLFDHQQYLLRQGLFEAYNQWIFGAAASPSAYQVWVDTHDKQAASFKQFQQSRIFKIPKSQYYW
ncbi:MAG: hypothetical protein KGO81_01405 [Bacteroidota bacterium]|nr:hypothetical protein [Bacteroidota bacterium]